MKKYLTKEQSQDLINLGIHQDKASFVSWKQTHNWDTKVIEDKKYHIDLKPFRPAVMGFEQFECHDIFSLSDLMEIVPDNVDGNGLNIKHKDNTWIVGYYDIPDSTYISEELIDALYHTLLWYCETFKMK